MKAFTWTHSVLATLAIATLAGCGGSASALGSSNVGYASQPALLLPALGHQKARPSWMAPAATNAALLYVSDRDAAEVTVYTYPQGKLVGTLTDFTQPQGECVDKAGDVFITDRLSQDIFEYAHGATSPVATLSDAGENPYGCSVDPKTGNLAVTNLAGNGSTQGSVSIYKGASGTQTMYTDSAIYYYGFCGYDTKGNLFLDGTNQGSAFEFAELPKGSSTFTNITLNQSISYPGGVQWNGKYVAVGDWNNPDIYEFAISGSSGTLVGSTALGSGDSGVSQFWIQGKAVIAPDENSERYQYILLTFKYPAGGTATQALTNGINTPWGTTVSIAN